MDAEEVQRKQELITNLKSRKHEREKQAAQYGVSADPVITLEIQELDKQMRLIEKSMDSFVEEKVSNFLL